MSMLNADGSLAVPYSQFIAVSRYARWKDEIGRREVWTESVDRYVDFMVGHLKDKYNYVPFPGLVAEIRDAIKNLDVVPSMRALMTAGPALELSNVAGYNCSYLPVDDLAAFSETLFILLNGTGVGFSVESRYVDQLPEVPEIFERPNVVIRVEDSKLGWAEAYKQLIDLMWVQGVQPSWDTSAVRPAGARLKTFGGRASGPGPLEELFGYTADLLWTAQGRKLTPLEVHDLMCKIASVVVVGGVRRSAMISLSDLNDREMAEAKTGEWYKTHPHRALANNSAVYQGEITYEAFEREWLNLMNSGSGERGIFSRNAARKQASLNGLRSPDIEYGTNPCLSYETLMLTSGGLRKIGDLAKTGETFKVYNGNGSYTDSYAWPTGMKNVYRLTLSNGQQIDLTDNHVIEVMEKSFPSQDTYNKPVERTVGEIAVGDRIRPFVAESVWTGGVMVDEQLATALGILFGDGCFHKASGNELFIRTREPEILEELGKVFSVEQSGDDHTYRVRGAWAAMAPLGFEATTIPNRNIPEQVFTWTAAAVRGFLRGLFSANGSAMPKHNRIDLKSVNIEMIRDVQRLLSALGYNAYVTTNKPQTIEWENGRYESRESYDLNLAGAPQYAQFQDEIGFVHEHKSRPCVGNVEGSYKIRTVTVTSIEEIGEQEVFDFHESETHWGWANGLKVHNCGEIILRPMQFCNLSEVIVRSEDTERDLVRKVRLATILGTWQSSLTDFPFLRPIWKENTEAERLLGVSLTGIFGNRLLTTEEGREDLLASMWATAQDTNVAEAARIGIPRSAAITTVKPSGTVSQLAGVSSGIHPWHSRQYIRTVRADSKDPLAMLMKDYGVPNEPDVMQPESTLVFSFPIKAPDLAVTRDKLSAIEHLEHWLAFKRGWCDHNPSVTISVREGEWHPVGEWVWEHLDELTGVSFLPYSEHVYKQAPYQEVDYSTWRAAELAFPRVTWSDLSWYETEDGTAGSQTLACSASGCDSADLVSV